MGVDENDCVLPAVNDKGVEKYDHFWKVSYGTIMAMASGYVNANTKSRCNVYGGFMTGNSISLGAAVAEGAWEDATIYAVVILMFFLGSLLGWICQSKERQAAGGFKMLAVLMVLVTFICETLLHETSEPKLRMWSVTPIGFVMGMIDLVAFGGTLQVHVTFMTGNIQKVAGKAYDLLKFKVPLVEKKVIKHETPVDERHIALFWLAFVLGAAGGNAMAMHFPWDGQLLPTVLIVAVAIWIRESPSYKLCHCTMGQHVGSTDATLVNPEVTAV